MPKTVEYYKCNACKALWRHEWDDNDKNNDYTVCPECDEHDFDFDEISYEEYSKCLKSK